MTIVSCSTRWSYRHLHSIEMIYIILIEYFLFFVLEKKKNAYIALFIVMAMKKRLLILAQRKKQAYLFKLDDETYCFIYENNFFKFEVIDFKVKYNQSVNKIDRLFYLYVNGRRIKK